MPYLTLTLSGQPVDLPADAAVALSYRANDLRNLDSREASFSESFTLPITAQNVAVLGSPHSLDSLTTTPYRLLPAVLTSPGGVVLLNGFAILELSHEGYDVTLTDALGGLFAQLGDEALSALDLSQYDHVLSYEAVRAADGNGYLAGYTYPLADTGALTGRDPAIGIGCDELPAAVYAHTLLVATVARVLPGYRVTGSLLAEDTYRRMVLPRATAYPQLRQSYLEDYRVLARWPKARTYERQAGESVDLQFELVQHGQLFAGTYYFPPGHAVGLNVDVTLTAELLRDSGFSKPALYLLAQDGTGPIVTLAQAFVPVSGRNTVQLTARAAYLSSTPTMRVFVRLQWLGLTSNSALAIYPGGKLTIAVAPRSYPGAPVHLDASLPKLSQADFLKLLCNQANLIIQADPVFKTVRFDLFNDLERNRNQAVDWTDRLDLATRPKLAYVLGDYAQQNTLTYAQAPDAYTEELFVPESPYDTEARGADALPVVNATLPGTSEAYAADVFLPLPHAAAGTSLAWLPFFSFKAGVPVVLYDETQRYDGRIGYVYYRGRYWQSTKAAPINGYSSNPPREGSEWKVTPDDQFFSISNQQLDSVALVSPAGNTQLVVRSEQGTSYAPTLALTRERLTFADLLLAYYPGLAAILKRVQLLTVSLRLTALDIANLDYTIPRRLDLPHRQGYGKLSCLAYVNSIEQYQPGLPGSVECQLLVLGNPVPGLAPTVPFPVPQAHRAFVTEDAAYYLLSEAGQYFLLESD